MLSFLEAEFRLSEMLSWIQWKEVLRDICRLDFTLDQGKADATSEGSQATSQESRGQRTRRNALPSPASSLAAGLRKRKQLTRDEKENKLKSV